MGWAIVRTLLVSSILCSVYSFEFKPGDEFVKFGDFLSNIQQLSMDENNVPPTVIVIVSGADSEPTLYFADGVQALFNPTVELRPDGDWAIIAQNSVDFEQMPGERFLVQVSDDTMMLSFNLLVNNLEDEPPSIITSTCIMKENTTITIENTTCAYTVSDPDGFLNHITYTVVDSNGRNESDIFEFQYKTTPPDNIYETEVYLVLKEGVLLDYEVITLYIFILNAKDGGGNPTTPLPDVQIVVEVEDVKDMPPIWTDFFYMAQMDEKSVQTFQVSARDGDFGINYPINYKVYDEFNYASVDTETGLITISNVDRDAGHDTVYVDVTAYDAPAPEWNITDTLTFIINDIDDQKAVISIAGSDDKFIDITIDEKSVAPLDVTINMNDRDFGVNALYSVELVEDSDENKFTQAFQIVPDRGYQESEFSIAVKDSSFLRYSDPTWRTITFTIHSIGDKTPSNEDFLPVQITLRNIHDEPPVFELEEYVATVPEDIGVNEFLATVFATDLDEDDEVSHSLLGTMATRILLIDAASGDVTTGIEDAFDYEKQIEVYVQVQAEDLFNHRTTTQLTIYVTDVNDEDPRMTVASTTSIEENQEDGTELDITISAYDVDTKPYLEFSILWDESYAIKNSQQLTDEVFAQYLGCIVVETARSDTDNNTVEAKLAIRETVKDNTPDYEVFDTLFLRLQVHDVNTVHGSGIDKATVVINVININDNDPIFTTDAVAANRSVTEGAVVGTSVGSVLATDADNPPRLFYYIKPTDDDTPDWITIDELTGALTVKSDEIDCDKPVRYFLGYTITVSDGERSTELDIQIYIIDVNDNPPVMAPVDTHVTELSETGVDVYAFNATDDDRDEPNNVVEYTLPTGISLDIAQRFQINARHLIVNLEGQAQIEWTRTNTEYKFSITCYDNPSYQGNIQNRVNVDVTIIIDDINDKKPIITTESVEAGEDLQEGEEIDVIQAVDEDSDGPNSEVDFKITHIQRFEDEEHKTEIIGDYSDLLDLQTDDEHKTQKGTLTTLKNLKGYYGYYVLTIQTQDFGVPINTVDNTVLLEVRKFNFESPSFEFPKNNAQYYLATDQNVGTKLKYYSGDDFDNLLATDNQGGKYDIKFEISFPDDNDDIFQINNADSFGHSQAQLQLSSIDQIEQHRNYTADLTAYIPGEQTDVSEKPYTTSITIIISFFDLNEDPVFNIFETTIKFTEGPLGLDESQALPRAAYTGVNIPDLDIFYLIKDGDDREKFNVDKTTGVVTLNEALDCTVKTSYELTIQSSRRDGALNTDADEKTQLHVIIDVIDINDHPPVFEKKSYTGQIMTTYPLNTRLLQVVANDVDVNDVVTYTLDESSLVGKGNGLPSVNEPFKVGRDNGEVSLNFPVLATMNGYFTFTVYATDPAPELHNDTTEVKIYVVTEENCVNFRFENTLEKVENEADTIKAKLDDEFNLRSSMETPKPDQSSSGTSLNNQTIAPVYFIDESKNEAVDSSDILKKVTDITVFTRLRRTLLEDQLILMSFDSSSGNGNLEEVLKAWLIGVSVVLGALCLILLVAFVLKTRALNQRISNLSSTKFGSQESGLNRQGVAAPTTNKHAVEGSNPVYNNEIDTKEIDRTSIASGDSDLIGVEDNPEFSYDNFVKRDPLID